MHRSPFAALGLVLQNVDRIAFFAGVDKDVYVQSSVFARRVAVTRLERGVGQAEETCDLPFLGCTIWTGSANPPAAHINLEFVRQSAIISTL
jgi:hypothetical protein